MLGTCIFLTDPCSKKYPTGLGPRTPLIVVCKCLREWLVPSPEQAIFISTPPQFIKRL